MDPNLGRSLDGFPSVSAPFFCPCVSFRQEQFWVKIFEIGGWPHSSTGGHVYLLEVVSSNSISQLLDILSNVIPIGFWEPLIPDIWGFLVIPPGPCFTVLHVSIHSSGSLNLSPVSSHIWSCPLSPPHPLSHPGPSLPLPPMIILFHFLSGIEAFKLWPSFL